MKKGNKKSEGALATNRKARHEYEILETFVAGMVLTGTEVKSASNRQVQFTDSFARIMSNELVLINCHISPYSHGNQFNHEPTRTRKLLMKRKEIERLRGKMEQKGLSLIPLKMFRVRGWIKIELGLGKGRQKGDQREKVKKERARKEMREIKNQYRI